MELGRRTVLRALAALPFAWLAAPRARADVVQGSVFARFAEPEPSYRAPVGRLRDQKWPLYLPLSDKLSHGYSRSRVLAEVTGDALVQDARRASTSLLRVLEKFREALD